jgi:hypothetical protein
VCLDALTFMGIAMGFLRNGVFVGKTGVVDGRSHGDPLTCERCCNNSKTMVLSTLQMAGSSQATMRYTHARLNVGEQAHMCDMLFCFTCLCIACLLLALLLCAHR